MHAQLTRFLTQLEQHFRSDERCLGMFLAGSLGRGTADEYSDVDVAMVIREDAYEAVAAELRPLCERLAGPIVLWLLEGEQPGFCNYAFLFEAGSDLLLCDAEVVTDRIFSELGIRPDVILFDKTGILRVPAPDAPATPPAVQGLARWIDNYWVYASLSGKYSRRGDLYKLLYAQGVLLQSHLRVLNALQPEKEWRWWADDVNHLGEEKRRQLLVYFPPPEHDGLRAALAQELDLFSRDAQAACEKWGIPYPHAGELAVRRHLAAMGALLEE